jgi:mRNA interferase HicA
MKGSEFLRKIKTLAHERGLEIRWEATRGHGSHGTLYLGSRFTIVQSLAHELKPGTLQGMLKQLGLKKGDLR